MVQIPQGVFDAYTSAANDMIMSNFGVNCQLFFPPSRVYCTNCIFNVNSQQSTNVYADGGPAPFNFGPCPICAGQGYIEQEVNPQVIKMRVYYRAKDFVKMANIVNIPESAVQVIGFRSDEHTFRNAVRMIVEYDKPAADTRRYERIADYVPFGLGQEKPYFICMLKRCS